MQKARAYLHHLRHGTKQVQKELKDAGEVVEHGIREVAKEAPHVISPPCERAVQSDADTEGKLSGKSHGDVCAAPTAAQREDHKRPQSAGENTASERRDAKLSRKGRRRASISEGDSPGTRTDQPSTPPILTSRDEDATEDTNRGRSTHTRQNTDHSAHRSLKHRRLESLKFEQGSREASPTRSVRFADTEGRNGTITPRSATQQNDQWFQANQVNDSPLEDESTRGRVTFDLPPPMR